MVNMRRKGIFILDFWPTNIVRCIAGCLQGVPGVGLLCEPKVSQLKHSHVVCQRRFSFHCSYLIRNISEINIIGKATTSSVGQIHFPYSWSYPYFKFWLLGYLITTFNLRMYHYFVVRWNLTNLYYEHCVPFRVYSRFSGFRSLEKIILDPDLHPLNMFTSICQTK